MLKVAVIVDNNSVTEWQKQAIAYAQDQFTIDLVLSCNNTKNKRNYLKNFLYYALMTYIKRSKLNKSVPYRPKGKELISFESIYEGNWQRLPPEVGSLILDRNISVVIKLGMNLLKVDDALKGIKVFSFHHGDPAEFRGRPAGFYELVSTSDKVGCVVQEITNSLDRGTIWASAHCKIHHHSFKKTIDNLYMNSTFLLRKAIINYSNGSSIDINKYGNVYRLPDNLTVIKFIFMICYRKLKRVNYGLFYEKKWNVTKFSGELHNINHPLRVSNGNIPGIPERYTFYADPFFSVDGSLIRVEAMNALSGHGEIVELDSVRMSMQSVLIKGEHYSYPFSFYFDQAECILPEIASHSSPFFLKQSAKTGRFEKFFIKGLADLRAIDATIFEHGGTTYLFCGLSGSSSDCLFLFFGDSMTSVFSPHPLNPIVIDPRRARMGGRILIREGRIFRFGQNNAGDYGDGITVCEITSLSTSQYAEKVIGKILFEDARGPHTLDIYNSTSILDFYTVKFSFLAGYRRIMPRFKSLLRLLH